MFQFLLLRFACFFAASSVSDCSDNEIFEVNRANGLNAVNVLYLLSKHKGIDTGTEEFVRAAENITDSPDMLSMSVACNKLGCQARVVRLGIEDLEKIKFPACILLNGEGSTLGKWNLLVFVESDHVGVIRGDSMIIDFIALTEFRSQWNGYVIVGVDTPSIALLSFRITALFLSIVIVFCLSLKVVARCARVSPKWFGLQGSLSASS